MSGNLANMAKCKASNDDNPITRGDFEALLNKRRESFKTNVAALINESTESLKSSVECLGQQVASFNSRLTQKETLAGENFGHLTELETVIKALQSQCGKLL